MSQLLSVCDIEENVLEILEIAKKFKEGKSEFG